MIRSTASAVSARRWTEAGRIAAPLRLLFAGDFLLDAHTSGLSGLPDTLWPTWSEARYTSARRVFDTALEQDVDAVLLSGRLLAEAHGGQDPAGDGRNFRSAAFLADQFDRLGAAGIRTAWHGPADQSPVLWPAFLGGGRGVTFLEGDGSQSVNLWGRRVSADGSSNIVLEQDRLIVNDHRIAARTPQPTDADCVHGAVLVTISDTEQPKVQEIACDTVRFHERSIDLTDGSRWDQIDKTMRSHVRQLQQESGPSGFHCVRWTVRGHGAAWARLFAPGPISDLLAALRALATEGETPVFADSITPVADETQLARWTPDEQNDERLTRFATAVTHVTDRPLSDPATTRAISAVTTLA